MENYQIIKKIIEEISGIEDISVKSKKQKVVILRAICIKICCEECTRVYGEIIAESYLQIGLTIGRDRVTAMYWNDKFDYWKTDVENVIYVEAKERYEKYLKEQKEIAEIKKIQTKIKSFSKSELVSFIPFLDRYMRLNKIAS